MWKLLEVSIVDQDITQHVMHVCLDVLLKVTCGSLLHELLSVVKEQIGKDASQNACLAVFLVDCEDLIKVHHTAVRSDKR